MRHTNRNQKGYVTRLKTSLTFMKTACFVARNARRKITSIQIIGKSTSLFELFIQKAGKISKDFILKICDIRCDTWSADVKFRVNSALSDLHAADARYHQDCKTLFLHLKYVDLLAQKSYETLANPAHDYLKFTIKSKQHEKEMWNSVEIYNMYSEKGGY